MTRIATGTLRVFLVASIVAAMLGQVRESSAAELAVTQAGAPGAGSGNFPFSLGFRFTVDQEITVTELGRYDWLGDGIDDNALAQLYNWDTGFRLGAAAISPSAVGESDGGARDVQFGSLRQSVSLRPGNNYLVAVEVTSLDFGSDVAATPHGVINYVEGRATPVGSPALPSVANNSTFPIARNVAGISYLGPNFKFDLVDDAVFVNSISSRQVLQRDGNNQATVPIAGGYAGGVTQVQARSISRMGGPVGDWVVIDASPSGGSYAGSMVLDAGWYDIEVRTLDGTGQQATSSLPRVGVGDVFITAGQSNSANHGAPAAPANSDQVSERTSASGNSWVHAEDPMSIATGSGGSPWPELGDLWVDAHGVPVGFVAVGVGATRVDQWQPGGSHYDNRLKRAIHSLLARGGFAAILWHQGESDSLAGTNEATYQARLEAIIDRSRADAGWEIPWGVALASYHPSSSAANEAKVIAGQSAVIASDPLVFEGAFTDDFVTNGWLSDSVHFNATGQAQHAARWFSALEEFLVVPEPASLTSWLCGMWLLLCWRRAGRQSM